MKIGELIRSERESKGISVRALAKEIGVSDSYLSKVERDVKVPSVDLVAKIGKILDMPMIGLHMALLRNEEDQLFDKVLKFYVNRYDLDIDLMGRGDCRIADLKKNVDKMITETLFAIHNEDNL